jgi:hypothetical protein
MFDNPRALSDALGRMTQSRHSMRRNKQLKQPIIHYAINMMELIPLLAQYNEELLIDEHIEVQIRDLIRAYMATETRPTEE